MTKKLICIIDFLCQIEILLLNMFKLLKISGFLFKISQIPGFQVKWQPCPGFLNFFKAFKK